VLRQVITHRSKYLQSHAAINTTIRAIARRQNKGREQSTLTLTDDSALQSREVKAA
jgi:hypothetical protein